MVTLAGRAHHAGAKAVTTLCKKSFALDIARVRTGSLLLRATGVGLRSPPPVRLFFGSHSRELLNVYC